ncbi:MAG: hypothetical protein QNJ42_09455 [Crocosphaera sp.]|nr:hypothetical protein [Crocosphaera sp.]
MPLVFVHGVRTRMDQKYQKEINTRDKFFKRYILKNLLKRDDKIYNPYWGDRGALFYWNHASVPSVNEEEDEELGLLENDEIIVLLEAILGDQTFSQGDNILLEVAQQTSLENVIDLIWAASLDRIPEHQTDEWVDLAIKAIDYAQHNPHPDWFNSVEDNYQFLYQLQKAVSNWELQLPYQSQVEIPELERLGSLNNVWTGIREGVEKVQTTVDQISESASRMGDVGGYQVGRTVAKHGRPSAHPFVSDFVGDVCVYLNRKKLIVDKIIPELKKARKEADISGNKLIVVAHSMGGNIMYDILTHFQPDLKIDLLVTVGSQVSWFEELKLFEVSDWAISANAEVNRVPKPAKVDYWLNIYDPNDLFSFRVTPVFQSSCIRQEQDNELYDLYDWQYSTGKGIRAAHTTYFHRVSFYDRLTKHIQNSKLWNDDNNSDP